MGAYRLRWPNLALCERLCDSACPKPHDGIGGQLTDVYVETVDLDDGVPVIYRDAGPYVRLAHDPRQIDESAALALLCVNVPRLVGDLNIHR